MKKKHIFTVVFGLIFLSFGNRIVKGEESITYHKAGDVGVFCIEVEVAEKFNSETSIFTANASNDKAYLLFIKSPQSMAERLQRMEHHRNVPTPEQQEIREQLIELYDSDVRQKLNKEQQRKRSLQDLIRNSKKPEDEAFINKLESMLAKTQSEIDRLTPELEEIEKQIRELNRKQNELRREARKTVPGPKIPAKKKKLILKVFGRFNQSGHVKIDISVRDSDVLLAKLRPVASVDLELPAEDVDNPILLGHWAQSRSDEYLIRSLDSRFTSYYQYCMRQSGEKYKTSGNNSHRNTRWGRPDRNPDLYSMTTGALAIQESLQLNEMAGRTSRSLPRELNVPLTELKGPEIKSHPFEEMLKGKSYETFPAAEFVPYDNYYCHFTSISKEIAASDLMKTWGTSLLRSMSVTARDADVPSRYQDQLCIDISDLTRLLGDFVIGEVAITGGDPFLREGSDTAAIIEVKNKLIFDQVMNSYAKRAVKANPGTKRSKTIYEDAAIQSITSNDRSISSHSVYLGKYKVYSNSLETLKLIIDTHAKKRKSMADNLDFKYMRTIFPGTEKDEDGFIYMSDSFIRKLLSPKWKIGNQRRIICQNHMRMIANASTMYDSEMKKKASIDTLIEKKYLDAHITKCPDNGSYSIDESGRAFCSVHNCLQYCTPISNIAIENATMKEASDYKQFVERYNSYWSRYFDPIGIRLKLGDRIEVETCILPLIENSIYNQLREIVGGEPVNLDSQLITDGTIVSVGGKLRLDTKFGQKIQMFQKQILPSLPGVTSCVGDDFSINFYDSDVLFTFAHERMSMFGGWLNLEQQLALGMIASSINLPMYAVLDLKDEELAEIYVRELLKLGQRKHSSQGFSFEPYSAGKYKGHDINTVACSFYLIKFRLHYAIASNRLIVSTKRYVLEKALDAIGNQQSGGMANVQLKVKPKAFDKLRPVVKLGWQERMRQACLKNLEPVRTLIEVNGATENNLDTISKQTAGVTLRCPSGGNYKYDSKRSMTYCSVHGNWNHPKQPNEINENEGLIKFMNRMKDFSVNFKFTEEGIMTKISIDLEPEK